MTGYSRRGKRKLIAKGAEKGAEGLNTLEKV